MADVTQNAVADAPQDQTNPKQALSPGTLIAQNTKSDWVILITLFLVCAAIFAIAARFMWFQWMPALWVWGLDQIGVRSVIALVGAIYLVIMPFVAFGLFSIGLDTWKAYKLTQNDQKIELAEARANQRQVLAQLDVDDTQYPIRLVEYSHHVLEEYYILAKQQATRSFTYSLTAMWLGFAVLLIGVADYFIPVQAIITHYTSLPPLPAKEFSAQSFVLITGVVLEFISVAFLWMYRFSIKQQTYYYRRQLKLHNVLLATGVSKEMKEGRDATLTKIIDNLLVNMEMIQIDPPSTDKLKGLVPG